MKVHGLGTGHQPARMENIKDDDRTDHHRAVKGNEVPLRGDQVPAPALGQLDSSVDATDIDADDGEDHRGEEGDDGAGHGLQKAAAEGAADEVRGKDDEDGDGGHLEDDACDHDVGAWGGVAVDFVCRGGGHAAADGLDDE